MLGMELSNESSSSCCLPPQRNVTTREYSHLRPRSNRVVHPPLHTQGLADLAHRAIRAQRLPHRRQEIGLVPRGVSHRLERLSSLGCVPLCPDAGRPLELAPLGLGVEPVQLDALAVVLLEPV